MPTDRRNLVQSGLWRHCEHVQSRFLHALWRDLLALQRALLALHRALSEPCHLCARFVTSDEPCHLGVRFTAPQPCAYPASPMSTQVDNALRSRQSQDLIPAHNICACCRRALGALFVELRTLSIFSPTSSSQPTSSSPSFLANELLSTEEFLSVSSHRRAPLYNLSLWPVNNASQVPKSNISFSKPTTHPFSIPSVPFSFPSPKIWPFPFILIPTLFLFNSLNIIYILF